MITYNYPNTAVILAAGQGTRLFPYTKDRPKCMLMFGDVPLIELQVRSFRMCGISNIIVVTGYRSDLIESYLRSGVTYVHNKNFAMTSSMYSLWLALNRVEDGCFVLNSDVLFHPEILRNLVMSSYPNVLSIDFEAYLNEEEMKVKVNGRRVIALSKSLHNGDGENVGLLKFDSNGVSRLFHIIDDSVKEGFIKEMVPYAVNKLAKDIHIEAVSVDGLPWIEIDFPEDYKKAVQEVFPRIQTYWESHKTLP